ncbi:MAG: hypothetical protein ABWY00_03555, partial [Dongiaceae bacterium]
MSIAVLAGFSPQSDCLLIVLWVGYEQIAAARLSDRSADKCMEGPLTEFEERSGEQSRLDFAGYSLV